MLDWFNTTAAAVLCAIAGWAVMSPRVQMGLLIHTGLVLMSVGFLGTFLMSLQGWAFNSSVHAANALVHLGLVLCAAGYFKRARRSGNKRRASDWVDRIRR